MIKTKNTINSADKVTKCVDFVLNAWLCKRVVVLQHKMYLRNRKKVLSIKGQKRGGPYNFIHFKGNMLQTTSKKRTNSKKNSELNHGLFYILHESKKGNTEI